MSYSRTHTQDGSVEGDDSGLPSAPYKDGEWDAASGWSGILLRWTFSVATPMIERGLKVPLQANDLMELPVSMRPSSVVPRLAEAYRDQGDISSFFGVPRLIRALIQISRHDLSVTFPLTFIEGYLRILSAVILRFLLEELENPGDYRGAYRYATILCISTISITIIHHILFFFSMRLGYVL